MNGLADKPLVSVNRGWLKRQCEAGKLWLKCEMRLTDDYAFDAAYNFGKMDNYKQAIVRPDMPEELKPVGKGYREEQEAYSRWLSRWEEENGVHAKADGSGGKIVLYPSCFKAKSGCCYCTGDKNKGSFNIHSSLYYEYEVR